MADKEKGIWNGGSTNISRKEAKIFRQMEDTYDIVDSEIEFREDLVKRQKIMDKTRIERKPMHELYNNIDYEKKTPVTGMGGIGGPVDAIRNQQKSSEEQ